MPQEAAVGVKKIIAVRVEECKSSRVKEWKRQEKRERVVE
jgi:hypothetical protein